MLGQTIRKAVEDQVWLPDFLTGGGNVGSLMRVHDWTTSPLGHPSTWPQSLRSVVGLLLGSKFPMFVAWGPQLGFLYNDSYAEILGGKHPNALGRRFYDIWSEIWSDISPLIDRAMAGEATYCENLPLIMNRQGFDEQTWFTFSYSPVRDESGKVAGMFCAVTETTKAVLAEQSTKQAYREAEEASLAKSEFLANMSHEIRTPLNAVVGIASLLERGLTPEKQALLVQTLRTSADALLELINDLLDISKIEQRDFDLTQERFAFDELIADVISMLMHRVREKNIPLNVDYESVRGLQYNGDKQRIRQILMNLIGNAIKFTEKGMVTVRVLKTPTIADCPGIEIQIIDTGIGIPQAAQAHIFEKFNRGQNASHIPGTGLGLSITRHLIEMMGGKIRIESKEGMGTSVYCCLPDTFSDQLSLPNLRVDTALHRKSFAANKRILLVEDLATNVVIASAILDEAGIDYDVARDGNEAMNMLKQREYDLVLMDVNMPVKDGLSATRELRMLEVEGKKPRISVIGMTAHALAGDRDHCLQAGMDDFLSKPVTAEALYEKIRAYL